MGLREGWLALVTTTSICVIGTPAANAAAWAIQPSPHPRGATSSWLVRVSCPTRTMCVAVGSWTNEPYGGYDSTPLLEQWNGKRWSLRTVPNRVGTGRAGLGGVSCSSTKACTAVGASGDGSAIIERWNGVRWNVQRSPAPAAGLGDVSCPSARVCVAVGASSSPSKPVVERWNGRAWSLQRTPRPRALKHADGDYGLVEVSCPAVSSCMAVGDVDTASGSVTPLAERWNGLRWTLEQVPIRPRPLGGPRGGFLTGVSCPASNVCYAVGLSELPNPTLVERWNGSVWSVEPTPSTDGYGNYDGLQDLSCASATRCLGVPAPLRRAGAGWTAFPDLGPVKLRGVSCVSATGCTGVGSVQSNDPTTPDAVSAVVERYS